jgi:hypothetical protein
MEAPFNSVFTPRWRSLVLTVDYMLVMFVSCKFPHRPYNNEVRLTKLSVSLAGISLTGGLNVTLYIRLGVCVKNTPISSGCRTYTLSLMSSLLKGNRHLSRASMLSHL